MVQKFEFQEMNLKGAYIIKPFYASDDRGGLIKDYNIDTFRANGIEHELKETFYTISKRGTASGANACCISSMNSLSGLALPLPIIYSQNGLPFLAIR